MKVASGTRCGLICNFLPEMKQWQEAKKWFHNRQPLNGWPL